ncbi:4a-hydroxytetrahydrobiopterin dehydratase [Georgenia subflava]|uniref:Putative pterin-4-alpha-carbinolamine dehydratase n=1 Tax=Georgenia subflava TaxID=1622177 RepID=A0A6N7EMC2_9MICO|nr:4a-hydroxytetrahydrobiopterin dehydratase [Georgenia subflava]MPV38007.1 4a-hydroxytetrahydrobiopterin dehydratase [Georgenia subflava]
MPKVLSEKDVQSRPGLQDWRVVARRLHGTFRTGSMVAGIDLVRRIGDLAEQMNHHPDIDLRYYRVHVVLTTHDAGGLTENDVTLANRISALAAELGIDAEPARASRVEIAVDAIDIAAVLPFWQAVLGYKKEVPAGETQESSVDLTDPDGRRPNVWFQQMDVRRPQRNRIHVDVHVPHDVAEARVAAAVEAGGHVVTAGYAPSWWVLADPEENEVCVCTWQARD